MNPEIVKFFKQNQSRTYKAGERIMFQSEDNTNIFFIESGMVKFSFSSEQGQETNIFYL